MQFLTTTSEGYISLFFTLALMLVLLYFMIYRPQKKQEKKDAAMRSSLEIGDQVTTIGGVIGRVVAIKDDTFVLETGADRVRIEITKWAVSTTGVQSSGEEKSSKEEKKEDEVKKTEEIPEAPAEETDASSEEEKKD